MLGTLFFKQQTTWPALARTQTYDPEVWSSMSYTGMWVGAFSWEIKMLSSTVFKNIFLEQTNYTNDFITLQQKSENIFFFKALNV